MTKLISMTFVDSISLNNSDSLFHFSFKVGQPSGVDAFIHIDGSCNLRQLSFNSIRQSSIRSCSGYIWIVVTCCMGYCIVLHHFCLRTWIWWSDQLFLIASVVATRFQTLLFNLFDPFSRCYIFSCNDETNTVYIWSRHCK